MQKSLRELGFETLWGRHAEWVILKKENAQFGKNGIRTQQAADGMVLNTWMMRKEMFYLLIRDYFERSARRLILFGSKPFKTYLWFFNPSCTDTSFHKGFF